jgi:xanthine/CO dehydrogenase XdhC/CoxF family maturation factor
MKEIKAILQAYEKAQSENKQSALVTVVQVEGSSYRRPGARMLVTEDGRMTGAISGGCLEGDALRKALLVLHQQKSKLVTYDTSDEEDASIGIQLGCAGIIQVLMEPIRPDLYGNPVELFRKLTVKRQSCVLITLFSMEHAGSSQWGTCWMMEEDGISSGNLPDPELLPKVRLAARDAMHNKSSAFEQFSTGTQNWNCFIEYVPAPVSLLVVGAGNDIFPLIDMATILGWDTTILDGRPTHANRDRFQSGCQLIVSRPEQAMEHIQTDQRMAATLMTHNYAYDKAMLRILLNTDIPYIGLLGPRKKLEHMLQDLGNEGYKVTEEQLKRVYGPVGFDLGAETADEIALSIIAEIQAFMAKKAGPSLKNKKTGIHSK